MIHIINNITVARRRGGGGGWGWWEGGGSAGLHCGRKYLWAERRQRGGPEPEGVHYCGILCRQDPIRGERGEGGGRGTLGHEEGLAIPLLLEKNVFQEERSAEVLKKISVSSAEKCREM